MKPEKARTQFIFSGRWRIRIHLLGNQYRTAFRKDDITYEKRGNAENYIKEAKYEMAVGHLLLHSFWANEAIFQVMILTYISFLLFKMDIAKETEYQQQIKTSRLKYLFLAGNIIRTARSV